MESNKISIIVPTYNEIDNIAPLASLIAEATKGCDYEVLFIDDDSKDGTAAEIERLAASYPLRVIVRKEEKGLASAVVEGTRQARGNLLVVMDADLQHPPDVIPRLIEAIEGGADISIASRYVEGGSVPGWGLIRRIISKGAIFLAHALLPLSRRVKDVTSGFFAFKKGVIEGTDLQPRGYKILLEVLMVGRYNHVAEVPFAFATRSRGQSKLTLRQQTDYLRHMLDLMKRTGELKRFAKFMAVGLSGVVVNTGILWLLTEKAGLHYVLSAAVGIETSIITNFLLNNRFTFRDRNQPGATSFFARLAKFNAISLTGSGINLGVLGLLTEVFGLYYIVSHLFGIAAAFLWNFFANNWWTWRVR